MTTQHILVVEDDEASAELLVHALEAKGFDARAVGTLTAALGMLANPLLMFDAIILDLGLPDGNGLDVCKWMKAEKIGVPVLVVTGSDSEQDLVGGLAAGATHFVTKPYKQPILIARLKAMLAAISGSDEEIIAVGPWAFKAAGRKLLDRKGGRHVRLTDRETAILKMLHGRRGGVVQRGELLAKLWGYKPGIRTHTIESHVYRLRKKIEIDPEGSPLVVREVGGYSLSGFDRAA